MRRRPSPRGSTGNPGRGADHEAPRGGTVSQVLPAPARMTSPRCPIPDQDEVPGCGGRRLSPLLPFVGALATPVRESRHASTEAESASRAGRRSPRPAPPPRGPFPPASFPVAAGGRSSGRFPWPFPERARGGDSSRPVPARPPANAAPRHRMPTVGWRRARATDAEAGRPHPRAGDRIGADRHRPGLRVRLLRYPGVPGAAGGGPAGQPGQLQPRHDHDRPRVRRRHLRRTDHARVRGAGHRR